MDLIQLLVLVIVMGLVFWLVQAFLPIPQPFKNIALAILVVIVCVWLLSAVGLCSLPAGHGIVIRH